ncbi:hypothetical protein Tco_1422010 [Tanacetum coccineum]
MLAICSANEPVAFQAPKTTHQADKLKPEGTKPGAKTGQRKKSTPLTMNNPLSKLEVTKNASLSKKATESQTGHSKRKKKSDTAKEKNLSQPSASTLVVIELHRESIKQPDMMLQQILQLKLILDNMPLRIYYLNNKATSAEQEFNTFAEITQSSDEVDEEIKLEDLSLLVKDIGNVAMNLDSLGDDQPFLASSEDEEEIQTEANAKTKDNSVCKPPLSPKSIMIQELSTQVLLLQSHNIMLEKEKAAAELLTTHDFSASLLTELKELSSKVSKINKAVGDLKKYVEKQEIKVPCDLKVLPEKLEELQSSVSVLTLVVALENIKLDLLAGLLALPEQVSSINVQLSKLKVLDALPSLLNKVTKALDRFATTIESTSHKAGDTSVPSAGQTGTHSAEGEKYINQVTITQLFQRRVEKDSTKVNLNKETNIPTTNPETTIIPQITTTTTIIIPTPLTFQSPFIPSPSKSTSQTEGEQVKYKGKKVVSHKEMVEEESKSDSDAEIRLLGSLVESSKQKPLKKFAYINEQGETF